MFDFFINPGFPLSFYLAALKFSVSLFLVRDFDGLNDGLATLDTAK